MTWTISGFLSVIYVAFDGDGCITELLAVIVRYLRNFILMRKDGKGSTYEYFKLEKKIYGPVTWSRSGKVTRRAIFSANNQILNEVSLRSIHLEVIHTSKCNFL